MNIQERVNEIITAVGSKHWTRIAKKDEEFVKAVDNATKNMNLPELSFTEKVCAAIHGTPICENGKKKTYNTIVDGWRFCGRAGVCPCAAKSVSENGKKSHAERTPEQIAETVAKRSATNIEIHGVANPGQTERAKQAHKEFYQDKEKVAEAMEKNKNTMRELYGVDNALQLPEVNEMRKNLASNLKKTRELNKS